MVDYLQSEHCLSQRSACKTVNISRSSYRYEPDSERDRLVIEALQQLAEREPTYGFGLMFDTLRREGKPWNHKRVYRLYKMLKLNFRRKGKKRLSNRYPQPLVVPETFNQSWSMDFMSDALMTGRRFRTFNVLDDFNRQVLAIEIDLNLPAPRVIRVLDRVVVEHGYPEKIRLDNGPEFVSIALADWAEEHGVLLDFIEPGKPTQNSFIERFNRTYRTEVLDLYLFSSLHEVKEITDRWMIKYNENRPHQSLGKLTPVEYRLKHEPENSSIGWH